MIDEMPEGWNMFYPPSSFPDGPPPTRLSWPPRPAQYAARRGVRPSAEVRRYEAMMSSPAGIEAVLSARILARRPVGKEQIRQAADAVVREWVRENPDLWARAVVATELAKRRPQIVATMLAAIHKPALPWDPPAALAPGNHGSTPPYWRG